MRGLLPGLSSLVNLETLYLDKDLADANKPDTSMLTKLVNTDGGNFAMSSRCPCIVCRRAAILPPITTNSLSPSSSAGSPLLYNTQTCKVAK